MSVEFIRKKRSDVRPRIADKDLSAKLFLEHIMSMEYKDAIFFSANDEKEMKKVASRIRTRLWRYAEAKYIKFREFNVWRVEGGLTLIRNIDPLENFTKRNLKTRRVGRAV